MKTRTSWTTGIWALVMMAATLVTGWAEPPPLVGFAGPGFGVDANGKSNYVASANSANGGVARILYLNTTGGNPDNVTSFYGPTATATMANYVGATTSVPVASTNGFASGDVVVIRHRATDTYEMGVLTTFTSATNLTLTANQVTACAVGDVVYKMEAAGSILTGAAKEINAPSGLWIAKRPGPVLLRLGGTSVGVTGFAVVSGDYR